jgi:hypothetical protein
VIVVIGLLYAIILKAYLFSALPAIQWIHGILSLGSGSLISGCSQESYVMQISA